MSCTFYPLRLMTLNSRYNAGSCATAHRVLYVFCSATPAEMEACSESPMLGLKMRVFSNLREYEQRNRPLFVHRLLHTFQRIHY